MGFAHAQLIQRRYGGAISALFAFTSATIRAGLIGASLILTPNGASAFSTAPIMAAIDAMVPPSPAPFRPSGLTGEAVSVWRIVIGGMSVAVGNRYSAKLVVCGWAPPS